MEHWLEWEIAQWVHPMKDRSDDPLHHERTLLPRSYISLHIAKEKEQVWDRTKGVWTEVLIQSNFEGLRAHVYK